MKKQILTLALLAVASMSVKAQSCDAAYPIGNWSSDGYQPSQNKPYSVSINVTRTTGPLEFDDIEGLGTIFINDTKSDNSILSGVLNYAGKGMTGNMGNGIYYFEIGCENGPYTIGLKKTGEVLEIVSMTGALANHPALKLKLKQFKSDDQYDYIGIGRMATTDQDILNELRNALKDNDKARMRQRTQAFGNVQQFITAHANLDPSKPKYLKSKGTGAINIRKSRSTTAAKIGELPVGQTLLVTDEYEGWCQVQLEGDKRGWVSLSVVTLTNTPATAAAATSSTSAAATSFVLGNGKLGPLSIGQTVSSLPKSVPGLYDRYQYKKEEMEDMDGSWTEERCHFYKGGKEIFKAFVENNKLVSLVLEEGSGFIKTSEGFYVGCPARNVFQKKRMQWETWYQGTAFARSGHWEFHIPDEGLNGAEYPTKLADIKQTAKICQIVYYKDLPQ